MGGIFEILDPGSAAAYSGASGGSESDIIKILDPADFSGTRAAEAAGAAALAQQKMAKEMREAVLKEGRAQEKKTMNLAKATPQELQAYNRQLQSSMKQIAQREKMIAAIDPALMEASEQVLKLLRGEESGMTKVSNQQRQRQRQELVNSLRSQYGPGAESSSIGQQRLQQFDAETNMLTQQTQQGALAQVFDIAGSAPQLTDRNAALSALTASGQNFGGLQSRLLDTQKQNASNMLGALSGTSQQMINSAGAQYVQPMMQAQGRQNVGKMGLEAFGMYMTGGASAAGKMGGGGGGY